jgi:hypothetical protein
MAGRAAHKLERQKHLEAIGAQALPLPSERRTSPVDAYTPDLIDEALDLANCGLSEVEIAAHWAIDIDTLRQWEEAHTDFEAALSRARSAAEAWWEEKARRALELRDNRFPAGAWAMVMKARFPNYRERVEVNHRIDITKRLVLVDLRTPGLLGEQGVDGASPLIESEVVRLDAGLTPRREAKTDPRSQPAALPAPEAGRPPRRPKRGG